MLIPLGYALNKHIVRLAGDSEDMIFTLGADVSAIAVASDIPNLAFNALVTAMPAANWGSSFTLVGVESVVGTSAGGTGPYSTFVSTAASVAGTSGGTRPPNNTAALVTKVTGTPGRRGRGRMFIPGWMPSANIDQTGTIDPAVLAVRQGLLDDWFDQLVTDSIDPVLFHATAPATPSALANFRLESKVATQRTRMRP